MATFSKSSFDAVGYALSRPSYPAKLYNHVTSLHPSTNTSKPAVLLDLGCGPGLSTFSFVDSYDHVVGIDPSKNMVDQSNKILSEKESEVREKMRFEKGNGERLDELVEKGVVETNGVDKVVAGQAAHWFNPEPVYDQLSRILKPGGSFVFFGYGEMFFPNPSNPKLNSLIPEYSGGLLREYWQQPGRSIAESLLSSYPFPKDTTKWDVSSFRRDYFLRQDGKSPLTADDETVEIERHELLLEHEWNLEEVGRYLRTWSSAHTYDEKHGGDVAESFLQKLKENGFGKGKKDGKERVGWEMGIISGRLKA